MWLASSTSAIGVELFPWLRVLASCAASLLTRDLLLLFFCYFSYGSIRTQGLIFGAVILSDKGNFLELSILRKAKATDLPSKGASNS